MNNYSITVKDKTTGTTIPAGLTYLDGAGAAILLNGQPVTASTDTNGQLSFTAGPTLIKVRVSAGGYVSQNVDLQPGATSILLEGVSGPVVNITAQATGFLQRNKTLLIFIALVIAAAYLATKYKFAL